MSFEDKLKNAINRGRDQGRSKQDARRQAEMSAEARKDLYNQYRLELCDYIEVHMNQVVNLVPGFRYETQYGDRGWGGAISRDDVMRGGNFYSRLEVTVRPFAADMNLLAIVGRGTIRNQESLNWNHFADLLEVDLAGFKERIDGWIVEYVERFSDS
jgi:hypothetical protein